MKGKYAVSSTQNFSLFQASISVQHCNLVAEKFITDHWIVSDILVTDLQFPIDVSGVQKDHPFLDTDSLQSLFRRLHALNRCAKMKVDNMPKNSVSTSQCLEPTCILHLCRERVSKHLDHIPESGFLDFWTLSIIRCRLSVTGGEVWIGTRIYWTLTLVSASNYDSLAELLTPNISVTTAHIKPAHSLLAVAW
jgi:hypothetical protein